MCITNNEAVEIVSSLLKVLTNAPVTSKLSDVLG